ncbi:MAG: hypothetical protein JJU42_12185 [Rhodobacteraceae bacterium]|nr:hypothetical protein [Paracoccaceae bacterium]
MIRISQAQIDTLRAAQERGFRRRAWNHVKSESAALGNPDDARLMAAFDLSEAHVRHWGLGSEQVRIGLLKLAIMEGERPFRDPQFAAIMSDGTRPERQRLRMAAAYLQEIAQTTAPAPMRSTRR